MIEETLYRCKYCRELYKSKDDCQECENAHSTVVKVGEMTFKPYKVNQRGYPLKIKCIMSNGNVATYRLASE